MTKSEIILAIKTGYYFNPQPKITLHGSKQNLQAIYFSRGQLMVSFSEGVTDWDYVEHDIKETIIKELKKIFK